MQGPGRRAAALLLLTMCVRVRACMAHGGSGLLRRQGALGGGRGIQRRGMAIVPAPIRHLGQLYNNWMLKSPVAANFISGTTIVAAGDIISQCVERDSSGNRRVRRPQDLDLTRLFNAGVAGLVFNGVLMPQWYVFLHRLSPGAETAKTIAAKIAANCVAWGCIGNGGVMLFRRMMDGEQLEPAWKHTKSDLWGVMMNDYKVWPAYDVLCFKYIPRHFQAMSTATLSVGWAAYLSYVTSGSLRAAREAQSSETKPQ